MKKTILFAISFFAVFSSGCLPRQELTGRVMDTSGPVPGAAVLAMVWVEDADKAFPAPIVAPLSQEQVTTLYEIDKAHRGLPAAYARAFTDTEGFFTLDKLNFSNETGKAVRAMSRPEITRITLVAFQRGHIKHAATVFPKGLPKELPPALIILPQPEGWKQLALDNYFRMLKQPEYENGYSKDYGATKEEKKWFLDYVSSNLNEAYQASDIKGDKQWEKDCGRDFSDVEVSTAGMRRNPAHERCNELLHQAGVLRNWEESWLAHSLAIKTEPAPAVKAISEALEALGPEYAEVRQYEAQIMEGAKEAGELDGKNEASGDLRNGLSEGSSVSAIAQRLYNTGDKAGAYKALGHSLYNGLPANLKRQTETAMLPATAIPGITGAAAGFYLLVNKPLTAQLPNGAGNHKDKPETKVEKATDTQKNSGEGSGKAHIEDVTENGHRMLRFFDKDGKKAKDIPFESKDVSLRVQKGKPFTPAAYKIKMSTQLAQDIGDMCKVSDRDVALIRKESKEANFVRDGKFLVTEESVSDFLEPADADDSERAESPAEFSQISRVYDRAGNLILELPREEGWQPVVSNTGQYFVVTVGEYQKSKILNRSRNVLAEFDGSFGPVLFSRTDRYILLVQYRPEDRTGTAFISVFDTNTNKLGLKKIPVPWSVFASNETPEIQEDTRTLIVRHAWDPGTKAAKVDKVQF